MTVDVDPVPSGGATLPVRWKSPDVTDLAAGRATLFFGRHPVVIEHTP